MLLGSWKEGNAAWPYLPEKVKLLKFSERIDRKPKSIFLQ